MHVFVAGATGAVGKRLVPALLQAGHRVTGMMRSPAKADALRSLGVQALVVDAFDRDAVMRAVTAAKPDAIVHQLTAIPNSIDFRKFAAAFALTNRLRTESLDHFLAAAKEAGVRRFIAQSFTGWPNERAGTGPKSETDPLDPTPAPELRTTLEGIRYLESAVLRERSLNAVALRYGFFYGPNTSFSPGGAIREAVRTRKFPVVGSGAGVWSFAHMDDVAAATVAALENGAPGIYNIVDDDPAPVREWLPYLAQVLGAPAPLRVPAWLARYLIGEAGVSMMTEIRGSANTKAKRELSWRPMYPSWREGFAKGLSA